MKKNFKLASALLALMAFEGSAVEAARGTFSCDRGLGGPLTYASCLVKVKQDHYRWAPVPTSYGTTPSGVRSVRNTFPRPGRENGIFTAPAYRGLSIIYRPTMVRIGTRTSGSKSIPIMAPVTHSSRVNKLFVCPKRKDGKTVRNCELSYRTYIPPRDTRVNGRTVTLPASSNSFRYIKHPSTSNSDRPTPRNSIRAYAQALHYLQWTINFR